MYAGRSHKLRGGFVARMNLGVPPPHQRWGSAPIPVQEGVWGWEPPTGSRVEPPATFLRRSLPGVSTAAAPCPLPPGYSTAWQSTPAACPLVPNSFFSHQPVRDAVSFSLNLNGSSLTHFVSSCILQQTISCPTDLNFHCYKKDNINNIRLITHNVFPTVLLVGRFFLEMQPIASQRVK